MPTTTNTKPPLHRYQRRWVAIAFAAGAFMQIAATPASADVEPSTGTGENAGYIVTGDPYHEVWQAWVEADGIPGAPLSEYNITASMSECADMAIGTTGPASSAFRCG